MICKYARRLRSLIFGKCPYHRNDSETCKKGGEGYCGKFSEFEKARENAWRLMPASVSLDPTYVPAVPRGAKEKVVDRDEDDEPKTWLGRLLERGPWG